MSEILGSMIAIEKKGGVTMVSSPFFFGTRKVSSDSDHLIWLPFSRCNPSFGTIDVWASQDASRK